MTLIDDIAKIMNANAKATKIGIMTTELAYLPKSIDPQGIISTGDGGGLGVVVASQFEECYNRGLDMHLGLPEYYLLFQELAHKDDKDFLEELRRVAIHPNIHLVRDGVFRSAKKVYDDDSYSGIEIINIRRAIALTKDIGNIALDLDMHYPEADKLFQLNDWPTALGSSMLKYFDKNILVEMKWHNSHNAKRPLLRLNKDGYNTMDFHQNLFFENGFPSADHNADMYRLTVEFLSSGFLTADQISAVGENILKEALNWRLKDIGVMSEKMTQLLIDKHTKNPDAVGTVPNEPSRDANSEMNPFLYDKYGTENILSGKLLNKVTFQQRMGLTSNVNAPILYWPHRLTDPQKGSRLFLDIIPDLMSDYADKNLQIAFVASGDPIYVNWAKDLQSRYNGRVAIKNFDRELSEIGKAGSDFIVMPSLYEPRGLPQLEGPNYGTWTIAFNCVDGVISYDTNPDAGNGWVFNDYNHGGLKYGIGEAIKFYNLPTLIKRANLQRARDQNMKNHHIDNMINKQIDTWEMMLDRKGKKLIYREI